MNEPLVRHSNKVAVLASGGQDSITTLLYAIHKRYDVETLFWFNYGQQHIIENQMVSYWANKFDIGVTVIDASILKSFPSSLTVKGADVNKSHELFDKLPSSFVPGRNLVFFLLTGIHCRIENIPWLFTGVCQTDYSGYPDCRQITVNYMEQSIREGLEFPEFNIKAPLMHISKAGTFAMAEEMGHLDEVIEWTHTCYNGDRTHRHDWGYGCGACPACQIREQGWIKFRKGEFDRLWL
jgi:7-cyano-7-deazaguanine synthase